MRRNLKAHFRRWSAGALFAMGYFATATSCGDETSTPTVATSGSGGSGGLGGTGGAAGSTGGLGGGGGAVVPIPDDCPQDPAKTAPGVCGCGVSDLDTDGDGMRDCQEECDQDLNKTAPGECGCGLPDVDSDSDGALDCRDECPKDATATVAGTCGCGAPADLPLCLRHRYSFNGTGTTATDSVGGADGLVVNTTLAGDGTVVLAGVDTVQYVDLPNGIVSSLGPSATVEAWASWTGVGGTWQRVFDFGSSDQAEDTQGNGVTYLFVTPNNGTTTFVRTALTNAGNAAEKFVEAPAILPTAVLVHLAVVVDGAAKTLTLYQDGVSLGSVPLVDVSLTRLNDVNNWIGRSQWTFDDEFQGTVSELRIYGGVRSAQQIAAESAAGP
ncbi:MAG: LamG domain-containing protein, partial [Deltaproteobacteria bacterium]